MDSQSKISINIIAPDYICVKTPIYTYKKQGISLPSLALGGQLKYNCCMDTNQRRDKIIEKLKKADGKPVSASSLAADFDVSRQIIVGDIALLRASDYQIEATPRGYVLNCAETSFPYVGVIACRHGEDMLLEELFTIVDFGGVCIDVVVEHNIYGQISGKLNIGSRYEVELFMEKLKEGDNLLSSLSYGVHLHHIGCKDKEIFDLIVSELDKKGIICH